MSAHSLKGRSCRLCRCSFEAGVASKGGSIANCGLATTPAMFFSCVATGHMYDGGVMVTASHLPWNRNGLKFFTNHGGARRLRAVRDTLRATHAKSTPAACSYRTQPHRCVGRAHALPQAMRTEHRWQTHP